MNLMKNDKSWNDAVVGQKSKKGKQVVEQEEDLL